MGLRKCLECGELFRPPHVKTLICGPLCVERRRKRYHREYYEVYNVENRARLNENQRRRSKENPEANKVKRIAYQNKRKEDPAYRMHLLEKQRRWQAANRDKISAYGKADRARKREAQAKAPVPTPEEYPLDEFPGRASMKRTDDETQAEHTLELRCILAEVVKTLLSAARIVELTSSQLAASHMASLRTWKFEANPVSNPSSHTH